ncbi:hypothetical protein OROMI_004967 [Orobanche minor]
MKRSDIASGSTDRSFIANSVLGTGDHVCVAAACLIRVLFFLQCFAYFHGDRHGGYKRRNSRQRRTSDSATLADVFAAEVQRFFEISVNSSYEGFIFKTLNIDAAYEPSRQSNNWLKLKRAYLEGLLWTREAYRWLLISVYGTFYLACYDTNKEEFQSISKIGRLPLLKCKGFSDALLDERSAGLGSKVIPKPKIEEPCVSRLEKADFGFYLIFTYFFKAGACLMRSHAFQNWKKTDLDPHLIFEASLERGFISRDYFTTYLLCRQWLAGGLSNPLEGCGWLFFISYYI